MGTFAGLWEEVVTNNSDLSRKEPEMAENEEKSMDSVVEEKELRKLLSDYFEGIMAAPLCDWVDSSIREFTLKDTVYQELELEEDRCEKAYIKANQTMDDAEKEAAADYVAAIQKPGFKRTDLAYMAGAKDTIMMLRYMDVIRDR